MQAWQNRTAFRFDTLLLTLLAGVSLLIVRAEVAANSTAMALRAVCEMLLVVAISILLRRYAQSRQQARHRVVFAGAVAGCYPFIAEFLLRLSIGGSEPLELAMLTSMFMVAVVLSAFSSLPRLGGVAILLSAFLVLFTSTIGQRNLVAVRILAGVFGVCGLWWLMGS